MRSEMDDLEQRVHNLERRMVLMEKLFLTATGFDPDWESDSAKIEAIIAKNPAMSQTGVCRSASGVLSRSRAIDVLRHGAGRRWRIEAGAYNSLLYFPIHASSVHAEAEKAGDVAASCRTELEPVTQDEVVARTSF
jgi:hypothetical protein